VLLACGIKPDRPGAYNITFSVTSSSGLTATVSRGLIVRAACLEGEKLCPEMVSAGAAAYMSGHFIAWYLCYAWRANACTRAYYAIWWHHMDSAAAALQLVQQNLLQVK
jgi:hypothetical protein